jgi:hypothetical protein
VRVLMEGCASADGGCACVVMEACACVVIDDDACRARVGVWRGVRTDEADERAGPGADAFVRV